MLPPAAVMLCFGVAAMAACLLHDIVSSILICRLVPLLVEPRSISIRILEYKQILKRLSSTISPNMATTPAVGVI